MAVIKLIMNFVGTVLIATAVLVIIFSSRIEEGLKKEAETRLSRTLNTQVTIEVLEIALLRKSFELKGITILNPEGFKVGQAVEIPRITVQVNLFSIFRPVVIVDEVTVRDAYLDLRYELGRGTNLGKILEASNAPREKPTGLLARIFLDKQLAVSRLSVSGAKVHVKTLLPIPSDATLEVPAFVVEESEEGEPVTGAQIVPVLIRNVIAQALNTTGLLKPIRDLLNLKAGDSPG